MSETNLGDWRVQQLRLSIFPVNPIDMDEGSYWERLVGEKPDQHHHRRQPYQVFEGGPFGDGYLVAEADSNRVHWRMLPKPESDSAGSEIIGFYAEQQERFSKIMLRWLENSPLLQRIGFGGVLVLDANDLPDACSKLARLLPAVSIDTENTRDFMYGINRRIKSRQEIPELELNRLAKWSVEQLFEVSDPSDRSTWQPSKTLTFCKFEFDINTVRDFTGEMPNKLVTNIFKELVQRANELIVYGDKQ